MIGIVGAMLLGGAAGYTCPKYIGLFLSCVLALLLGFLWGCLCKEYGLP